MITVEEFGSIISFIASSIAGIFNSLDSAYLYGSISVLDVFVGLMFLDLVTWFVMKVLTKSDGESSSSSKKNKG